MRQSGEGELGSDGLPCAVLLPTSILAHCPALLVRVQEIGASFSLFLLEELVLLQGYQSTGDLLLRPPGAWAFSQGEFVSLKSLGPSETQCPQLYNGKTTTSSLGQMRPEVRRFVTSIASMQIAAVGMGGRREDSARPGSLAGDRGQGKGVWAALSGVCFGVEDGGRLGGAWEKAGPAWDWQLLACWQMVS